jgi:hypothetical protein
MFMPYLYSKLPETGVGGFRGHSVPFLRNSTYRPVQISGASSRVING